jgi:hypothetical protein
LTTGLGRSKVHMGRNLGTQWRRGCGWEEEGKLRSKSLFSPKV